MRKLKLEIELLAVDSFHASPTDAAAPGTVDAFEAQLVLDNGLTTCSCKLACATCTEYQTCRDCV